ncbi:MAG: class D beta-lactamase [Candidatus Berkiella sp.]
MKKITLIALLNLITIQAFASTKCFIAKENGKIIHQEGDCTTRHAPCSTFKIPISVMGFNENILIDEKSPVWHFKQGYPDWLAIWKEPHNPSDWMKNSCVWYSQVITQKLGMPKFQEYVAKLNYGNQDVSGDKGKNNGLTHAWLSSSLKVSPHEQIVFLEKLIQQEHPMSAKAQALTKNILAVEDFPNEWKLVGKTGSGNVELADGSLNHELKTGWYVGWLEKGNRHIIFAHYIEDEAKEDTYGGPRAKSMAKEKLIALLEN